MGLRLLREARRIRIDEGTGPELSPPLRALRTSLLATASNPLTIATWGAIFSAAAAAGLARSTATAAALVGGVGAGSTCWFAILSAGMAGLRRRVGQRGLRLADGFAGAGLLGFARVLGWQALRAAG